MNYAQSTDLPNNTNRTEIRQEVSENCDRQTDRQTDDECLMIAW